MTVERLPKAQQGALPALASTAPTAPLASPWMRSVLDLEAVSKTPGIGGRLPRPLTSEERSWILDRATSLLPRAVNPKIDVEAAVQSVTVLIVGLGGASEDVETARIKAQAYSVALSDVPLWAVKHAIARWLRDEVADVLPGVDVSWAPKPAQIRSVAMAAYAKVRSEYDRLQKLSVAEVEKQPRPAAKRILPHEKGHAGGATIQPGLRSMADAFRPQAQQMSDAERRLIEAMANGENVTPEMIAAAEQQAQ